MESFTTLVEALSTLLWPIIIIVVIALFRPAVHGLIESAKSRKFTLKIGGQELTMDEANEQQRTLIAICRVPSSPSVCTPSLISRTTPSMTISPLPRRFENPPQRSTH